MYITSQEFEISHTLQELSFVSQFKKLVQMNRTPEGSKIVSVKNMNIIYNLSITYDLFMLAVKNITRCYYLANL